MPGIAATFERCLMLPIRICQAILKEESCIGEVECYSEDTAAKQQQRTSSPTGNYLSHVRRTRQVPDLSYMT